MINKNKQQQKEYSNAKRAYFGFLFQSFFKRPFGYVVAILYVVYLAVIILIVPKALRLNPLFIWSNPAFNIPIFNIFFISAAASALAVSIFRTGRDDGTDLSLSSKPLTKGFQVVAKTSVYLIIMLVLSIATVALLSLTKPIYGKYHIILNRTGVTNDDYIALLLSVFLGNTITMLFFGGLAVLISLVGGQVPTMIATIGTAFIMCLMNVIFPVVASSPLDVLSDKYSTSINSYSANTLGQFYNTDPKKSMDAKTFAAIQCIVDSNGEELKHFDTAEYWRKANSESGIFATNYFDFGKQLSYLYTSFGLDSTKLVEASKLPIGANVSHNYSIDKKTHVTEPENLKNKEYPVAIYSLTNKQGVSYPIVRMLAGNMGLAKNNWYAISTTTQSDFNSNVVISPEPTYLTAGSIRTREMFKSKFGKTWFKMTDIIPNQKEFAAASDLFDKLTLETPLIEDKEQLYSLGQDQTGSASYYIATDDSNVFFEAGKWDDLSEYEKAFITSKIVLSWYVIGQQCQLEEIERWCSLNGIDDKFPYKSDTVKKWYFARVQDEHLVKGKFYFTQQQLMNIATNGIYIDNVDSITSPLHSWAYPVNSKVEYCETYSNLYQYKVTSFYNIYALTGAWAFVSVSLFASAVIVYRKIDFK